MEQINKGRNLPMNLLMGKLYRSSKNNRSAISCYKECLRFVPVIVHLAGTFKNLIIWIIIIF